MSYNQGIIRDLFHIMQIINYQKIIIIYLFKIVDFDI